MKIELCVPSNFILSERLLNSDPEQIAEILTVGEFVYINGVNLHDRSKTQAYAEQATKMAELQIQREHDILKQQYEKLIEDKNNETTSLKRRIEHLEIENSRALIVSNKLDSLMGKGNSIDNMAKGDFGETIIEKQLSQWWPESVIEDRSGESQCGDRLWRLNELRAMVEVKNVQSVRHSEIQKFERDLQVNTKNGQCNGAIFCSLKSETIPGKGKFKLEFYKNIPVIYIANTMADIGLMRFGFEVLINVQAIYKNNIDENEHNSELLKNKINIFVQDIVQRCSTMTQNLSNLKSITSSQEKQINEMLRSINMLKNEFDFLNAVVESSSKKDLVVQEFLEYYKANYKWPTSSEIRSVPKWMLRGEMSIRKIQEHCQTII